jgi:hypothetical protein
MKRIAPVLSASLMAGCSPMGNPPPVEVVQTNGANLQSSQSAFVRLRHADLIVLVVEARTSVVPVVENALGMLRTAFRRVDGVILNRRQYEVPASVMRFWQR